MFVAVAYIQGLICCCPANADWLITCSVYRIDICANLAYLLD